MKLSGLGSAQNLMQNVQSELSSAKEDPFGVPSRIQGAKGPKDEKAQIKELSNEFESLFLGIVLKAMRDTVPKSGLVDGGNAEDIYKSMLDTEYAKNMAAQRHTGIADNIEKFLLEASGNMDRAKGAEAKLQEAKGLKAYTQLPAGMIQETMDPKAHKPQ